jgi:hypothetical protein
MDFAQWHGCLARAFLTRTKHSQRTGETPVPRHFALAPALTFRNLFMMRQLLFILSLTCAFGFAHAADIPALKTNSVALGEPGTLEMPSPAGWKIAPTNLNLPDNPIAVELHAPNNALIIRFYIRWDGFGGKTFKPTEAEMSKIVSNNIVVQYLPTAVEKSFQLEKLHGPSVTGVFARITDANWNPLQKDTYPNLTEGMFRCGNIWGNFNVVTYDKDGPLFKDALKVLESMRRKP